MIETFPAHVLSKLLAGVSVNGAVGKLDAPWIDAAGAILAAPIPAERARALEAWGAGREGWGDDWGAIMAADPGAMLEEMNPIEADTDPWKRYTLADAYQVRPPLEYILAGLVELPSLIAVYGAPGTLKTFWLLDLAICVASGMEFLPPAEWLNNNLAREIKTQQNPVMWLDFDNGARRTHDRVGALARARELPIETPFYYYSMPHPWLDATDKASIGALSARSLKLGAKLIIIDNLGVVSGGVDENSAEVMQVMSLFRQLAEETGAAVVLIHHQRKANGFKGRAGETLRGHSSIEAALDLALLVEREELADQVSIKATKARGADVLPFGAIFTYETEPDGSLRTAKFFGVATEDTQSNPAIKREIKTALYSATMNKTDLVKAVKSALEGVGVNRIRSVIDRMSAAGELLETSGQRTEKMYSLP